MRCKFTKMQGLGNDFVVLDRRVHRCELGRDVIRRLADRRFGIGCDQVLVLEPSRGGALARMRVFNADGTPAEHCGNGARCVARYLAEESGESCGTVRIEIDAAQSVLHLQADGNIRADMGRPVFDVASVPLSAPQARRYSLSIDGQEKVFGAVSMGNPHAVFQVDDVESAPVAELGAMLQSHALFPAAVNVGFMEVTRSDAIKLRVFERGVGETLACGTAACAAVAVGRLWDVLAPRVEVSLRGGNLLIEWSGDAENTLYMTGPAMRVFEGEIIL